jgi:hypothetical protein
MNSNNQIIRIRGKEFEVVDVERTTTKGPLILLVRETVDQQKLQSAIFYATTAYDVAGKVR